MRPRALEQRALDLLAGHVVGVHDPLLAVSPLAREVQVAALVPRELRAELQELLHRGTALAAHRLHRRGVAQPVAGDVRVLDVRLDGVVLRDDGAYPALRVVRAALVRDILRDDGHRAVPRSLQRVAQAGDSAADHEEIDAHRLRRRRPSRGGRGRRRGGPPRGRRAVLVGVRLGCINDRARRAGRATSGRAEPAGNRRGHGRRRAVVRRESADGGDSRDVDASRGGFHAAGAAGARGDRATGGEGRHLGCRTRLRTFSDASRSGRALEALGTSEGEGAKRDVTTSRRASKDSTLD